MQCFTIRLSRTSISMIRLGAHKCRVTFRTGGNNSAPWESYLLKMLNRHMLAAVFAMMFVAASPTALLIAQPTPPPEPGAATKDVRETPRGALLGYLDACR